MNRDFHPIDQPDGTYRYALNQVNESREGELMRLTSEQGNEKVFDISNVISTLSIGKNRLIVFSVNEIGIADGTYRTIFSDDCLNFSYKYPVRATYRVRNGCDEIVYFTDGNNPVRSIDINSNYTSCDELALFPDYTIPQVDKEVRSGGSLEVGSYAITMRYLDGDENPTNWFLDLAPVYIYNDPLSEWIDISGDFNDETDPVDGVVNTDKAIVVSVTGADQDYDYYQLAVVVYTSGDGTPTQTLLSPTIPISQDSFTINNFANFTEGVYEDLLVEKSSIESAYYIKQIENQLILAKVKEKQVNWCGFQEYANGINVTYNINPVEKGLLIPGNSKHPNSINLSLVGGEVYALSVAFVFTDGYVSPFFNIPGREPTGYDLQALTVVDVAPAVNQINIKEVKHLGLQVGDTVPRWKVRNTAAEGKLGYYQTNTNYPLTTNCDGDYVWGTLAGSPIRHHRMPDRTLVDGDYAYNISLNFENVQFPREDIVGFVIGYSNGNTIVDKGFFTPVWKWDIASDPDYFLGDAYAIPQMLGDRADSIAPDQIVWTSPKGLFTGAKQLGDYFKIEGKFSKTGGLKEDTYSTIYESEDSTDTRNLKRKFYYWNFHSYEQLEELIEITDSEVYEPGQSKPLGGGLVINSSLNNRLSRYAVSTPIDTTDLKYGALMKVTPVLEELDFISYTILGDDVYTGDTEIKGGDCFISPLSFDNFLIYENSGSIKKVEGSLLGNIWVESKINVSLRVDTGLRCKTFFTAPLDWNPPADVPRRDYAFYQVVDIRESDGRFYHAGLCDAYYAYNFDLGRTQKIRSYYTLDSAFDCCSKCLGDYKNRVLYSLQSFQEESVDNYKVFLPNNYRDIEAERGEITGLFRYNNNLFISTVDALWYLPQNVQERVSAEGIVSYLGTGEFFALPPRLIIDSDTGRGGCIDDFATIKIDEGVFIVDSAGGHVYIFNGQLNPITEGMRSFFEENFNILRRQVEQAGGTLPYIPTYGCISAYDSRYERVILTHKDYSVDRVTVTDGKHPKKDGVLYWDDRNKDFYEKNGPTYRIVEVGDERFFCDRSWTLSYSMHSKSWVAFHSYTPDVYGTTKSDFYSFASGGWKHNLGGYATYFGEKYPVIYEYVDKGKEIWNNITFYTESKINGHDSRWDTYDQVILYNSRQNTGLLTLIPRNQETNSQLLTLRVKDRPVSLDRDSRMFNINSFRDAITDLDVPMFVEDCVDKRQTDKALNPSAFSTKAWHQREPMQDVYIVVRFILNKAIKLTTLLFDAK